MPVVIPDPKSIASVIADLPTLKEEKIFAALREPKLVTELNHWTLWLLVCLDRHLDRQKWLGEIISSHLDANLEEIGSSGAFGHPDRAGAGLVPELPGWRYLFHGRGCCLTHENGTEIDVDFTDEGHCDEIDPFFYQGFLSSLKSKIFPEAIFQRPPALAGYWHAYLDTLERMGCWKERGITTLGRRLLGALKPIHDEIFANYHGKSSDQKMRALYLLLHLGDHIEASAIATSLPFSTKLEEIKKSAASHREIEARELIWNLSKKAAGSPYLLQSLADLGENFAEAEVHKSLLRSPADGQSNQALEILSLWKPGRDAGPMLEEVIRFCASEMRRRRWPWSIFRPKLERSSRQRPYESQFVNTARSLLMRRCSISPSTKSAMERILGNTYYSSQGEAAFLLYILNKRKGLAAISRSLSDRIPLTNYEAAAACVLIGTNEAKRLLVEALELPEPEKQHAAACALEHFEKTAPIPELSSWKQQNDGLADPLGTEVDWNNRKVHTFTMAELAHAEMRQSIDWSIQRLSELSPLLSENHR